MTSRSPPITRSMEKINKNEPIEKQLEELKQKLLITRDKNEIEEARIKLYNIQMELDRYPEMKQGLYEKLREVSDIYKTLLSKENQKEVPVGVKNEGGKRQQNLEEMLLPRIRRRISDAKHDLEANKSRHLYQIHLEEIQDTRQQIRDLIQKIIMEGESISEEISIEWSNIESEAQTIRIRLQEKKEDLEIEHKEKSNVKLPKFNLPIFSGNYEEWPSFQDMFTKLIHEKNISKVEKMKNLKIHVRGQAGRLIQHLRITEEDYDIAWDTLKRRYQNIRLIAKKQFDKILTFPVIQYESAFKIKDLHDTIHESLMSLKNLGIDLEQCGAFINHIIDTKLDKETSRLYEQNLKDPHEIQELEHIMNFLKIRFESLEASEKRQGRNKIFETSNDVRQREKARCPICKQDHPIHYCVKLKTLKPEERIKTIKENKLCMNCMKHNETIRCTANIRCGICNRRHHTLLHLAKPEEKFNKRSSPVSNHMKYNCQNTLLATALIRVGTTSGNTIFLRALIDTGSQAALITEEAVQILGIPKHKTCTEVCGLGDDQPRESSGTVEVVVYPRFPSNFHLMANMIVLKKLTKSMPQESCERKDQDWGNNLLADPTYNTPGPIDIILGVKEYSEILKNEIKRLENGLLAQNTELGWILSGNIEKRNRKEIQVVTTITTINEEQQLSRFWEIEEVSNMQETCTEDEHCEEIYKTTTERNEEGRYTVKIPFTEECEELGNSRKKAVARFMQLEKRLQREPELAVEYKKFIDEYIQLNHMQEVPMKKWSEGKYYIPHQAVIKEDSTTTKLRVVFDASCKTSSGRSLNDVMYTGPRLQQELFDIVLRWRTHKVAMIADIEKMYRQILIKEDDKKYHRILWRQSPKEAIKEYELKTITYGTAAAPYLAVRTLMQLAEDEKERFPKASQVAKTDFYVDDLMSGANSIEEAIELQEELINLMKSGGFILRKWYSNEKKVLMNLSDGLYEDAALEITEDETKKSLGLHWAPNGDKFKFIVNMQDQMKITKRYILSEVAKVFDPLGWLAPVIITAKLIIQELWTLNVKWDEPVPEEIMKKWLQFKINLPAVGEITLPRWISYKKSNCEIELHGFCDASEKAYGAVLYSRVTNTETGEVEINLLTAKSKVAPIKTKTTLPRLELCAALLLAKLTRRTTEVMGTSIKNIHAWSDSMITIAWIQGDSRRWKTFVANRVIEINKLLPGRHWHHVRTEENPADVISRGINPSKFKEFTLWWNGPTWLKNIEEWPHEEIIKEPLIEVKRCIISTVKQKFDLIERFSSLTNMIRVLSYCRRMKKTRQTKNLTTGELEETMQIIIQAVQNDEYAEVIKEIKDKGYLKNSNKLSSLCPFIDDNGIVRVGGRLRNARIPYDEKHPIIIPQNSHLATLIIENAHKTTLHGGNQITLAYIRQKYWIPNGKKKVSSILQKCTKCIRYKASSQQQMMGDLPEVRVTPTYPFQHTGIDYAGPILIRTSKGRGQKSYKGYIAVFVCMTTKAIHLEVVSDMTTDTFLAAFKRFTSRRGMCTDVYSDNGTTFIGAQKIIEKEVKLIMKSQETQEKMASKGIKWHFIPPRAPNFGGLWEAGVKSMKHHFHRIAGDAKLTFEEISTLTAQIEACLNSRPLVPLEEDPQSMSALTPGHFLTGRSLLGAPERVNLEFDTNLNIRWKLVQQMKRDFWKRWSTEYLHHLQQRQKWRTPAPNIKTGDLVLIKDELISPHKWPLAKVKEVFEGKDKRVRVATMEKSEGTTVKRAINKIIPLKINTATKVTRGTKLGIITMITLCMLCISSSAEYIIQKPSPGMFIEHMGNARVERGIFQIQVQISRIKIDQDMVKLKKMVKQVENLCEKTKKLLDETSKVRTSLKTQESKLPSIFEVVPVPLLAAKVHLSETNIDIYGKFAIAEKQQFNQNEILVSPTAIRSIENSPHCVIDEIYQRVQGHTCTSARVKFDSIVWKQLYKSNAWMFICNEKTTIAIVCHNQREDVWINNTGIIEVSQECTIYTKQTILAPRRSENIKVVGSYRTRLTSNRNPEELQHINASSTPVPRTDSCD